MMGYTPKMEKPYIDEMMEDIYKLAHKNASKYTDNTCYALRFEDIVSEQMVKLVKVLNTKKNGAELSVIEAIPNRDEAFKFIATCLNNQARGLVIRHRKVKKRIVQAQDCNDAFSERTKNCEISIDSEEAAIQLEGVVDEHGAGAEPFVNDLAPLLTPLELMVIKELNDPSPASRVYMILDHSLGKEQGEQIKKYKLKFLHHAKGLGISLDLFKNTVTSIGNKINAMRKNDENPNQPVWNAAVSRLEEFFMVQVPRSMDKTIVRTLFTMASRDQFQRWEGNKEVKEDLQYIGAQLPQSRAGLLTCYGVLYQSNNKVCRACSLYDSCGVEAANVGLGDITIDPRILNNRQIRVPIIAAAVADDGAFKVEPKFVAAYAHVRDHFTFIDDINGQIRFKRPGVAGTNASALAITVTKKPFKMVLHGVEDVAIIDSDYLKETAYETYEVDFSEDNGDAIIALLNIHLQASYSTSDADSCI